MEETAIGTRHYDVDEFDSHEQLSDIYQYLQEKPYEEQEGVRNDTAEPDIRAPCQSSSNPFQGSIITVITLLEPHAQWIRH